MEIKKSHKDTKPILGHGLEKNKSLCLSAFVAKWRD
jgi:hypothetical protein